MIRWRGGGRGGGMGGGRGGGRVNVYMDMTHGDNSVQPFRLVGGGVKEQHDACTRSLRGVHF